jgi:hypothetical protein
MAAHQQVDRYNGDPWEEVIAPWVESESSVSISEVLEKCLQNRREGRSQLRFLLYELRFARRQIVDRLSEVLQHFQTK